jgi:hypothetical protein
MIGPGIGFWKSGSERGHDNRLSIFEMARKSKVEEDVFIPHTRHTPGSERRSYKVRLVSELSH